MTDNLQRILKLQQLYLDRLTRLHETETMLKHNILRNFNDYFIHHYPKFQYGNFTESFSRFITMERIESNVRGSSYYFNSKACFVGDKTIYDLAKERSEKLNITIAW